MKQDQHVISNPDGSWCVKHNENGRADSVHMTKSQAVKKAEKKAKQEHSILYIHGLNGRVAEKKNYDNLKFNFV